MNKTDHTHNISVNAFLICEEKFLLLKRARDPLIWSPPGGHLLPDEDPIKGLQREIYEETRLVGEVFHPVVTWFGEFKQAKLLSIDYLCKTHSSRVELSDEHTDFRWLSLKQIQQETSVYFDSKIGFKLEHFILAWRCYLLMENRLDELSIFSINMNRSKNE